MVRFRYLFTPLIGVSVLVSLAVADPFAIDGFDAFSPGEGIHGKHGWTVLTSTGGPTDQRVVDDPAEPGNRILELLDGPKNAFREAVLRAGISGTLYFRVRVPAGSGAAVDISLGLSQQSVVTDGTQMPVALRLNGNRFQVFHEGVWADTVSFATDVWYGVWMVIANRDPESAAGGDNSGHFYLFVQGGEGALAEQTRLIASPSAADTFSFRGNPPEGDLIRFVARTNNGHVGKLALLDDLRLYPGVVFLGPASAPGTPPGVDAGGDRTLNLPTTTIVLTGTVEATDTPAEQLSTRWVLLEGPGNVSFSDPESPGVEVTVSREGTYRLALYVSDGLHLVRDEMVLTVAPDPTVPEASFRAWQDRHFPSDRSRRAGPFGNPDRDSTINLVEYLFGGDPLTPSSADILPRLEPDGQGHYRIWFNQNASDGVYQLMASEDLANWAPVELPVEYDPANSRHFIRMEKTSPRIFYQFDLGLKSQSSFPTHPGYQGIWYDLGGANHGYGTKYSGGLGTYTTKHRPLAIYAPEVERTFFVYGGTRAPNQRHLLCMAGVYDHRSGRVSRPTIVFDKNGVDDPHDNPAIALDEQGYIWVFVAGRNTSRPGHLLRSRLPYDISDFEHINTWVFTYPQPYWIEGKGFFHFFTKYTPQTQRELYFSTSPDGENWAPDQQLAAMGGHYQISAANGETLGTAFNRHPNGNNSRRTDLYYIQTTDQGATWTTAGGQVLTVPLTNPNTPALIFNYNVLDRVVFVKDLAWDKDGHPIILYLTAGQEMPGPDGDPRIWHVAHWDGSEWRLRTITTSTHNYDVGSIYLEGERWRVVAPTGTGPQPIGQGGEVEIWESEDRGDTWTRVREVTRNSVRNHGYVRRPLQAHPDFDAFWADGNPNSFSESHLYIMNRDGTVVRRLPYTMSEDWQEPEIFISP